MDGCSRKIIWLKALTGNNNPKFIADVYIKFIPKSMIVPQILRAYRESENILVVRVQKFFKREHGHAFSRGKKFQIWQLYS